LNQVISRSIGLAALCAFLTSIFGPSSQRIGTDKANVTPHRPAKIHSDALRRGPLTARALLGLDLLLLLDNWLRLLVGRWWCGHVGEIRALILFIC
jgi:hypothetical protein